MSTNPTYRRIVAAGPAGEVRWFEERIRGLPVPRQSGLQAWKPRLSFSFLSLAELLPLENRPMDVPPMAGTHLSGDRWETIDGRQATRWDITDVWFFDGIEYLFSEISRRYPQVCWVSAAEDPDTLTAASEFYARGRVARYSIEEAASERITKEVYRRAGVDREDASDTEDSYAMELCDKALLDRAEARWDSRVARFLGGVIAAG